MTLKLLSLLADCVTEKAVDETADIISGKKEKKTLESIILQGSTAFSAN